MFRGATNVSLDDKGRLVVPTRYREQFVERSAGQLVVTINIRGGECLLLYPLVDWQKVHERLMQLPSLHPRTESLQRLLIGHATDLIIDGQGRVLLSPELRAFAGLDRKATLLGMGNRCELWDESRWMERRAYLLKCELAASELPPGFDSLLF
ncbi:MAG TPA: division/cell wall cluster transcriptional repressor MraZ [Steroidobacteraceae bacterium]|jgi:MraZ protein